MNININRYIYFWDIHWSESFKNFIDKYNDWKTFFYSTWDLFDRGRFSYENFVIIKELHEQWLIDISIWNHDLFFILSKWLEYNWKIKRYIVENNYDITKYKSILEYHKNFYSYTWGINTDDSFIRNFWTLYSITKETIDKFIEVSDYLWENFNIYIKDHNNNLIIHWWIPILPSWDLVHMEIDNKLVGWIKLLEKLNNWFKILDEKILKLIDVWIIDNEEEILSKIERFQEWLKTKDIYNFSDSKYLSPTWYESALYSTNNKVYNELLMELNNNQINNIFLWHWHNREVYDQDFNDHTSEYWKNRRVYRLDRSFVEKDWKYWTIWYVVFDNKNNLVESWSFNES